MPHIAWSGTLNTTKINLESSEARATRWMPQTKTAQRIPYHERLLSLNLLLLADGREIKDLTFIVCRNYSNSSLLLKIPSCETNTLKSAYFKRIVSLWNNACKVVSPIVSFVACITTFLRITYLKN